MLCFSLFPKLYASSLFCKDWSCIREDWPWLTVMVDCSKEVEVSRLENCGTCRGDGVKEGTRPSTCTTCGGSGQLIQPVRTPLGNFQQVIQCADCDGKGERFTPCGVCGGDGRVRKSKRIQLNVPAGKFDLLLCYSIFRYQYLAAGFSLCVTSGQSIHQPCR